MTIAEWLKKIGKTLQEHDFEQAPMEARFLLQAALGISPTDLILQSSRVVQPEESERLTKWLKDRAAGVPLAYLSGTKGFYKYDFVVEPGVLIPRPETELVVTLALKRATQVKRMADLGCGSGCIGLSFLKERLEAKLWAVDASAICCRVTQENAQRLEVADRTEVVHVEVEKWRPPEELDLIVSNPPYIPEGDPAVEKNVHLYEPHLALYSDKDGLKSIRAWVEFAAQNLRSGGGFVFEFGAGQSQAAQSIMSQAGFENLELIKDFAGIERVISGTKRG